MSISLKNHEDRITKIENRRLEQIGYVTPRIPNKNIAAIPNAKNYDILLINKYYQDQPHVLSAFTEMDSTWILFPKSMRFNVSKNEFMFKKIGESEYSCFTDGLKIHSDWRFEAFPTNELIHGGNPSNPGVYKLFCFVIYGLKLCYSFSYNIIYRATHLLEKILYVLNKGGVSL